jgi:hypothetical protein
MRFRSQGGSDLAMRIEYDTVLCIVYRSAYDRNGLVIISSSSWLGPLYAMGCMRTMRKYPWVLEDSV